MSSQYIPRSFLFVSSDITIPAYSGTLDVYVSTTTGDITLVLPSIASWGRIEITKISADANTITLNETINGVAGPHVLSAIGDTLFLTSTGTEIHHQNPAVSIP